MYFKQLPDVKILNFASNCLIMIKFDASKESDCWIGNNRISEFRIAIVFGNISDISDRKKY